MIDIVEIKRLCVSAQWKAYVESGKILLHDTASGETVCIGNVDHIPAKETRWLYSSIINPEYRFPASEKQMNERILALELAHQILSNRDIIERYCWNSNIKAQYDAMLENLVAIKKNCGG